MSEQTEDGGVPASDQAQREVEGGPERFACKGCGELKAGSEFYHYKEKGTRKSTRYGKCKRCFIARQKEYYNRRGGRKKRERWVESNRRSLWVINARARAKRRGLEHTIKPSDLVVPERCPLLDIKLEHADGRTFGNMPSIDRIDPTKGYTPENTWVISHRANTIKSDATLEELRSIVKGLTKLERKRKRKSKHTGSSRKKKANRPRRA